MSRDHGRTRSGAISMWQMVQSQLEEVKGRLGLTGLALANEDGLLIASSGGDAGVDAELVAAMSPMHREGALHALQEDLKQHGQGLEVLDWQGDEQSLFLCATSRDQGSRHTELKGLLQELAMKLGL